MAAFLEAIRLGADGVELDVRRSADGALVVHHDAALPQGHLVANVPMRELPSDIPSLDEALDVCEGHLVNVEIKNLPHEPDHDPTEWVAGAVAALLAERRAAAVVSSFCLPTLDAVRSAEPAVATAWLTPAAFDALAAVNIAVARGYEGLHPAARAVTHDVVERAHAAGLVLRTWTVDEPDRMRALAELGVDAVITNVPDVALEVLAPWRDAVRGR